jgi:hypothetical protein
MPWLVKTPVPQFSSPEIAVFLVDGQAIRANASVIGEDAIDFTQGGNGYKYDWIPSNEIWVDQANVAEMPFIVLHEIVEVMFMYGGMNYDAAHERANVEEQAARAAPATVAGRILEKLTACHEVEETMRYKDAKKMAVKFADEEQGIIEGLAAPFGGPLGGKDLQGEYFDKDTDFCEKWFASRPILYHHGLDAEVKALVVGRDTATKTVDNGRWLQAQLDKSMAYWKELKELIKQGKVFFSTGAVPHLVEKAVDGRIIRWPWVETSLTVSPANPIAMVETFKAIEWLKAVGITDFTSIQEVQKKEETKSMKSIKITCPLCQKEFDYEQPDDKDDTPASDTPASEQERQKPAENPGVNQGMAPETHVPTASVETAGQSGQHGGATAAPDKPVGDMVGKGETPKPAATVVAKEPEPPPAATQASDNTASSTGTPPVKSADAKVESDATKAMDGLKAMLAEHLKTVETSVREAVKPLEERIKTLEETPADIGPLRRPIKAMRVENPANPLPGEGDEDTTGLTEIFDDPTTPPAVKSYVGEKLAAVEVRKLLDKGPQRLGR